MDFNATIDLIIRDLNEAREIIDDLKRYPGVPVLQVELAKSKCRNVSEIIALLKDLKEEHSPEKTGEEPVIHAEKTEETITASQVSVPEPVPVTAPPAPEEQLKDKESEELDREKQEETPPDKGKDSGTSIIADKFSNLSTRLNEQMGGKKGEDDIGGVMKSKPLADLSDAIGINDRFMYIRELFNGNGDAYNQAIIRLNQATNLEDAKSVLTGYTGNNTGNDAVKQLLDLVKRKLTRNE